jgi:hypothetical protein
MEESTMAIGITPLVMVTENTIGPMDVATKVNGNKINEMAMVRERNEEAAFYRQSN